jgi:hypothetical protein
MGLFIRQFIQATVPGKHVCDATGLKRITTANDASFGKPEHRGFQEVHEQFHLS